MINPRSSEVGCDALYLRVSRPVSAIGESRDPHIADGACGKVGDWVVCDERHEGTLIGWSNRMDVFVGKPMLVQDVTTCVYCEGWMWMPEWLRPATPEEVAYGLASLSRDQSEPSFAVTTNPPGEPQKSLPSWVYLPVNGKRYLVKIERDGLMEIRTAEYCSGMWLVDGCESTPTILAFKELEPL